VPQILNYSDLTNSDSQVHSQAKINNELDHFCVHVSGWLSWMDCL